MTTSPRDYPVAIPGTLVAITAERRSQSHQFTRSQSSEYALGKWYQRFNRTHVTGDPLKTFHSLRHAFADSLKQAGGQESIISELMGHSNDNISTGRYGKRYRPQVLFEVICNLDYGLDFGAFDWGVWNAAV